ncbi:MAG: DUF4280 domain-containing protein [bacterium]
MPPPVVLSAKIMCSFGTGPGTLIVVPQGPPVTIEGKFAATIMDSVPMVNILPFPTCIAPTNPAGMAKIVPTPAPCIPVTGAPWAPPIAPTKMVNGKPMLLVGSTCTCIPWAGVITVIDPGTTKEMVS